MSGVAAQHTSALVVDAGAGMVHPGKKQAHIAGVLVNG